MQVSHLIALVPGGIDLGDVCSGVMVTMLETLVTTLGMDANEIDALGFVSQQLCSAKVTCSSSYFSPHACRPR
eukprot:SAG11_NODE_99_length_16913_cov_41.552813_10_plen_73_part_00